MMDCIYSCKKGHYLNKSMIEYRKSPIPIFTEDSVYQCLSIMWNIKSQTHCYPNYVWSHTEGIKYGYHDCRPWHIIHLTRDWPSSISWI